MKFLTQTENNNFKVEYDCLFNIRIKTCLKEINKDVNYYLGEDDSVRLYTSGALLTSKRVNNVKISFVKNDGEQLFAIEERDLNEMENRIKDINAYVCATGVLVAYEFYHEGNIFDYYTYNGAKISNNNLDKLINKIDKYEQTLGIYFDKDEPRTLEKPCTNLIMKYLEQ